MTNPKLVSATKVIALFYFILFFCRRNYRKDRAIWISSTELAQGMTGKVGLPA
jgi:hypothetical protein